MKTKLLLAALFTASFGFAQTNLVQNGDLDTHTVDPNDNADTFDMTPPEDIDGGSDNSPYFLVWNNTDLDTWLETFYGDDSEQPGSTSDGTFDAAGNKTRGVKLGEASRRLYQKVSVTLGATYKFSVDSRSEAENVTTEFFMLNEEILSEDALAHDGDMVDGYLHITNDFNSSKGNATTNTFTNNSVTFTATADFVVIYGRALQAVNSSNEVFYDNFVLVEDTTASVEDATSSEFAIYPNPANDILNIKSNNLQISAVSIYSLLGKSVYKNNQFSGSIIDLSSINRGVYILKIEASGRTFSKKLVVQ
ncbi:T9SS type A sorting domain-containing protein [Tamlana agarivorans]|uniref:T9SS type A sorting domain-containing protein n=1 Tax=Pseudotamlana agarivorans TaxID=481183 RepID=A0ACC5U6U8_9FLAO|nr:T9SS type A sorting domain-containing protein [Tamlana agarivorans]MBU2949945.1 T9SS type A sorting domain-containing protein [Tamlana agarivorans]